MPEVDFILAPEEQKRLIEHLLGEGLLFVPDVRYSEPKYVTLDKIEYIREYEEPSKGARLFFVLSPTFSQHSLEMHAIASEENREPCFCVLQRHGGPYLDLLLSSLKSRPAPLLVSGFSAYYSSYWIGAPGTEIPVPNELKALHKSILAWLRDHGRCVATARAGRRYWVGLAAEDMLLHGVRSNVESLRL